jgi:hypothetical protein
LQRRLKRARSKNPNKNGDKMEDSSLTGTEVATEVKTTEGNTVLPTPEAQASTQTTGQQPAVKTAEAFDYEWWKKDPRFGKIWKEEKDVFKSAYEADKILETKYKPAYKEYEGLRKKFEDSGLATDKIDDYIKEYNTLKSPENPTNQRANYFSYWIDNPKYTPSVEAFYRDLEKREMSEKFPGMNEEQIQKQIELEQRLSKFEEATKRQEDEKMVASLTQEVNQGVARIKSIGESRGFPITDDILSKFTDYCIEKGIQPKYMVHEFMQMYDNDISKAYENKIKSKVLEGQTKTNKTQIPIQRTLEKEPAKKEDLASKLGKFFK